MKITYVGHATLLIETGGYKLVTDPWVKGSAYCKQWYQFPKCLSPELITAADFVFYSHGHEDHLHPESLQIIQTTAQIFYPYSWYGGTTEFFNELGFHHITEITNGRTAEFAKNCRVTYLSNNLDNVMVFEVEGKVIVNINDALPSASPAMIDHFIQKINSRWKKIDYVFSSFGGASYFPNTVHYQLKNDVEIAETRELFFITNFCRIISGLNPTYGVPFASDFILLDDNQRWINNAKFQRDKIDAFYIAYTGGKSRTQIVEAYPNDYFGENGFHKLSPYHAKKTYKPLLETIDEDYKNEIEAKKNVKHLNEKELYELLNKTETHILAKQYIIPQPVRSKIKFAVKISNAEGSNVLNVNFREVSTMFTRSVKPDKDIDVLLEVKSETLHYTLDNEWGGDAIVIGYGAEIQVYHEDAVRYEYENYCVRLLSRYPNTKEYLKKSPLRALKYLLSDDTKRKNLLNRVVGKHDKIIDYSDKRLGQRDLWLSKDKCEVCKACNI